MTEPLNHHEALIYVMVASSGVDHAMTHDEFARIGEIVSICRYRPIVTNGLFKLPKPAARS